MKVLNNNVILKLKEEKKSKTGVINNSEDVPSVLEFEVIDCEDKKLIGKTVLVGKYAGERYKEYFIVPYSTILAIL